MWDDNGLCEPDIARASGYPCCGWRTVDEEVRHAIAHCAPFPTMTSRHLLIDMVPGDREDAEEWLYAIHGTVRDVQHSPTPGCLDLWVNHIDGDGSGVTIKETDAPPVDRESLVYEFLVSDSHDGRRPLCFDLRRPDPLFRLAERGRRLWFDARWPLPDRTRPLRTLTGSRSSAGWTDLAPAHAFLEHVRAFDSASALVAALADTARQPSRWGGLVLSRGGGGTPGAQGDWRATFDAPDVVDAIRAAQGAGLAVLAAIGHEADATEAERVADFAWPTPSALAVVLAQWDTYLTAELASPGDALRATTYSLGRAVRQAFDDAWARHHAVSGPTVLLPRRP